MFVEELLKMLNKGYEIQFQPSNMNHQIQVTVCKDELCYRMVRIVDTIEYGRNGPELYLINILNMAVGEFEWHKRRIENA